MAAQNGVVDPGQEAPIPCSVQDIVEVPSKTEENYTYLLRIPKLRERMQLEAKLGSVFPRLNQTRAMVQVMRENEEELHRIVGKPVLFEQFVSMVEKGEARGYTDVTPLQQERQAILAEVDASGEPMSTENAERMRRVDAIDSEINAALSVNAVHEAELAYESAIRRIDPRFREIAADQGLALGEYQIAMVESLLWGVEAGGLRYEGISRVRVEQIVDGMSNPDIDEVFTAASDLYNLRNEVKKS